jgi:DNA polymerase III epsilon subunit-like protein
MKIDAPKYVLAFDTETSGLASKSPDPSIDHKTGEFYQTVAWGVVVLDFATYEAVDTYKAFVQPVKGAQWNKRAEAVHGLSQEWLAANGKPEEDVMVDLFELILKYWGTTTPIIALGHNVMFDISFFRSSAARHGLEVRFSNRIIDTNSLFMGLTGLTGSDAMFETFGLPARGAHDPLEDILMTVICAKEMRNAYERGIACAACGT